jgi:hypothetical protein
MTNPVTDDELVTLWHTTEPSHLIAQRLCITNDWLRRSWERLRKEGKLPEERRRAVNPLAADPQGDKGIDGRPSTSAKLPSGMDGDPLYDLLVEHHRYLKDPLATPEGRPDLVKIKETRRKR